MYRKLPDTRGFSLIEMVLVVALMTLLSFISLSAYRGLSFQTEVDAAAHNYAQSLRKAHALARSMTGDTTWGVRVENERIIVFQGTSYASRVQSLDEVTPLEGALVVGGVQEVTFAKFSGTPSISGTTSFTSTGNDIRLVDITQWGIVAVRTGTTAIPPEDPPLPVPVVALSASPNTIPYNTSSTLTWNSTDATSCLASGGWAGAKALGGTETILNLVSSSTFTLSCTGPGGSDTKSAVVTVSAPPVPACTFNANPTSVVLGASATLTWTSMEATTAAITPSIGSVALSGSTSVSPTTSTTYQLSVAGPGGSASCTTGVAVTLPPPVNRAPVAVNDSYSITLSKKTPPYQATLSVLANDSDPDGDTLSILNVSTPTNGAIATISGTQIILSNIENGNTTFTYTISDGRGGTAQATVTYVRTKL